MLKLLTCGFITAVLSNPLEANVSEIQELSPLPNVDYLASGYNIFYGNPQTTKAGVDPGFKQKIFDLSYSENITTDDMRYLVPDGTSFKKNSGCMLDFSTRVISGTSSYYGSLSKDVQTADSQKDDRFTS